MLTADDRAAMLGEPVAPKSVFDYLSDKNKQRLNAFLSMANRGPDSNAVPVAGSSGVSRSEGIIGPAESVVVPHLDAKVAQSALKGFMPYGDDLPRQGRYKAYLSAHALPSELVRYMPVPVPGSKIADLNKELNDFASAANIFKPMSGMMANRFTSGTSMATMLDANVPQAGLTVPTPASAQTAASAEEEASKKKREEAERDRADPRRIAVKMGHFGPLTRSTEFWYPSRLLCKRFNVADPHPEGPQNGTDGSSTSAAAQHDVLNQDTMDQLKRAADVNPLDPGMFGAETFRTRQDGTAEAQPSQELPIPDLATVGLGEDETQGRDTLTYEKPSMDIFKAIFAESDDEDEDDTEDDLEVSRTTATSKPPDPPSKTPAKLEMPAEAIDPANIATFKPTFTAKEDRASLNGEKKKDKKKKKSNTMAMSFDIGEEDEGGGTSQIALRADEKSKKRKGEGKERDREKRHRKEKEKRRQDEDEQGTDDMWVEKAVQVPKQTDAITPSVVPQSSAVGNQPKASRMKASELF